MVKDKYLPSGDQEMSDMSPIGGVNRPKFGGPG